MVSENNPFHAGEVEIQTRLGVHDRVMSYAPRFIRDFLPDQHRDFYSQLPLLFIGSIDELGRPWASAVFGKPGFVRSPDSKHLQIAALPTFGDPLQENLKPGAALGFLGLEHHSRRRNRLSGKVVGLNKKGFGIRVDQAFGNCPQYIHARAFEVLPEVTLWQVPRPVHKLKGLNQRAEQIVNKARSFFISSYFQQNSNNPSQGADVSHRGGRPGFLRILDEVTLVYPEFSGNMHYNTLGNIHNNPKAGILVPDFEHGDLLYLTCSVEIQWDGPEVRDFEGAQQLITLRLDEAILVEGAMPLRWVSLEESPDIERTGRWEHAPRKRSDKTWSPFRITRVVPESSEINSYYLEPVDGGPVPASLPGQFIPIRVWLKDQLKPLVRTYTISARTKQGLRISIKREAGEGQGPGLVSNHFHDFIHEGAVIDLGLPAGRFVLDSSAQKPVVLLSAGVGITPMLAMASHLANNPELAQAIPKIHFIHGARNSSTHGFKQELQDLATGLNQLNLIIVYSQPLAGDRLGIDFHAQGRVDLELLKSLPDFDELIFYLCGPAPFIQELGQGLEAMGVASERIRFEFFAKKTLSKVSAPRKEAGPEVCVQFQKSGVEASWTNQQGSLLELAESAGLEPAFSCRSGSCQTCSVRIISGKVAYDERLTLSPEPGQALLCCARPQGPGPLVLEV